MSDTYSRDEVQAILGRALEQQQRTKNDALTHDELSAVAREMGVSDEALASATVAIREERAVQAEVDRLVARRRRGFSGHLLAWFLVCALFAVANVMTATPPWSLLVALGWGVGLAFHARAAFFPDRERLAARARLHIERDRRKAEFRRHAREVEKAVSEGVVDVLHAVAKVIDPKADAESATGVRVDANAGAPPPQEKTADAEQSDADETRRATR